jgi:cystathionine beta-lyase
MELANFLNSHSLISKVYYPGLISHEGHEIAKRQMKGFGGMLSIELHPSVKPELFLKNLKIIKPVMSLAGIESTANYPKLTSHYSLTDKERSLQGISDQLIRLSTGIESIIDLKNDIDNSLKYSENEN